jgi:hypothetical protein
MDASRYHPATTQLPYGCILLPYGCIQIPPSYHPPSYHMDASCYHMDASSYHPATIWMHQMDDITTYFLVTTLSNGSEVEFTSNWNWNWNWNWKWLSDHS